MSGAPTSGRVASAGMDSSAPPRSVRLARLAFGLAGLLGFLYMVLASLELRHLESGRRLAAEDLGAAVTFPLVDRIRDFTFVTMGLCVVAIATMAPFALFTSAMRHWTRIGMILICIGVGAMSLLVIAADGSTLLIGDVITPSLFGVDAEHAARLSAAMVTPWFPAVHYVTVFGLLVAAITGFVALAGSDASEYFVRHRRVGEDDPRLWSPSRIRDLDSDT
jgi:hypothetical protein